MNKKEIVLSLALLVVLNITGIQKIKSQQNFIVATGTGIQEMIFASAGYQLKQFKLALNVGTLPSKNVKNSAYSANAYYHFAGKSKYTSIKPVFLKASVLVSKTEDDIVVTKETWITLRGGIDFNISARFGFTVDGGYAKRISLDEDFKQPNSRWDLLNLSVFPAGSIQVFYRL